MTTKAQDYEGFARRSKAAGYSDEDTKNTWELMEAIERILKDEDLDAFQAPELASKQKVRLARLFIDRVAKLTKDGDAATAAWLKTQGVSDEVSGQLAKGAHWRWFHEQKAKAQG